MLTQIDLTDGVGVVGILPRAARLSLGPGAVIVVDKAYCRRHEEGNRSRFRACRIGPGDFGSAGALIEAAC